MNAVTNDAGHQRVFRTGFGERRTTPGNPPAAATDPGEARNWVAVAAHELRSPLGSIRGIAEFLHDGAGGDLTPIQRELVSTIHATSVTLLETIGQILDLTGAEVRLNQRPHDLVQLVERSVSLMNLEAAQKRTQFLYRPSASTLFLPIDAGKITQVVDNLLSNAMKYSPRGAIIVVTVGRGPEPGTATIAVRDQGPGIPAAERHKLFTWFGRLSTQPTGGEKSTGLGLAVSRKIVEAHHGRIDVENIPGGGCEFQVVLPALGKPILAPAADAPTSAARL